MPNGLHRISDLLSAPMEAVIVALGVGIARAQREMDLNAIETQREINEDPVLSDLGLQATWYQMPRVELELTMAIAMEAEPPSTVPKPPGRVATALSKYGLRQLHVQPVNASYANQFNYDVKASSVMKLTIVPVPPPAAETSVTPQLTRDQVLQIANLTIASEDRVAVNFNGQARLWFVLQYRLVDDRTERGALVVIDDETREVVKRA